MADNTPLPGFERLIATCRQYALTLEVSPPLASAPKPGSQLFGRPVDPLLVTLYQRVGDATLGRFSLLRPDTAWDGLIPWNEKAKQDDTEPFRSILLFGQEQGFAYYYGAVPALADATGLQPIVFAKHYPGEFSAVPIASNLDRFFDTYSRYLELMVVDAGYLDTGVTELQFPWGVPKLIAADTALLALAREGRFSHLISHDEGARDWVAEILSTS